MESTIRSTKAIAGALKRMENQPNNCLSINENLKGEAWQNSWDNYDDYVDFPDAYQDTALT